MTLTTKALRRLVVCAALAVTTSTYAQELKIVAPAAPGGGWDQTARSMQQALTSSGLAKSVQVTNIPGAGGTVGLAQFVNGARGDGSQILVNGLVLVGAILTNKSPVDLGQTTPIARLTGETLSLVVPASSPLKSAQDLAAAIKADPSKVTWAGGSAGGVDHIGAALFTKTIGVDPTKTNYIAFSGGGEALAALLGAKVTVGVSGYGEFESQIKAGKLRLLAITAEERIAAIDAPTLKEQGIDMTIANWRSVVAPPDITSEQRTALLATIDKLVKSDAWRETLKQRGWDDAYLPGDQFKTFLADEQVRVKAILTSVGLVKS